MSETIFRFVAHAYPSLAYNFRARKQIRLRLCFSRSPVFAYEIFRQHEQFLAYENVSHLVCAYVRKLTQTNLVVNHATHYAHMTIPPSDELDTSLWLNNVISAKISNQLYVRVDSMTWSRTLDVHFFIHK